MRLATRKHAWLSVVVVVLALVISMALAGCGASDEDQIKTAIDDEMGIIVDPTDEMISTLAEEASTSAGGTFDTMGIDSTEMVTSWLDGFSYEVGTISVDDQSATAEVTMTCKQLGPVMMDWQTNFQDNVMAQGLTSMDEIYAYAGQSLMEELDAASPVDTTVTLELEKDGSSWTLPQSSANQNALLEAMIGDYS